MSEATALPFDTPLGPLLPAAMYLAACAWPDSWPQRSRLVESLLHGGARAAGYRHAGPDARVIERRLTRGSERLALAFQAAEVAQLGSLPAGVEFGPLTLSLPSRHAVGRGGRVSVKRLQAMAANDWQPPDDPRDYAEGDDDFRNRVWRRFLPALPYVIPLKLYLHRQAEPPELVTLVRNPEWLEDALTSAEWWAAEQLPKLAARAEFIRLVPRRG